MRRERKSRTLLRRKGTTDKRFYKGGCTKAASRRGVRPDQVAHESKERLVKGSLPRSSYPFAEKRHPSEQMAGDEIEAILRIIRAGLGLCALGCKLRGKVCAANGPEKGSTAMWSSGSPKARLRHKPFSRIGPCNGKRGRTVKAAVCVARLRRADRLFPSSEKKARVIGSKVRGPYALDGIEHIAHHLPDFRFLPYIPRPVEKGG